MTGGHPSGYDGATGICWQFKNPGDRARDWRCTCPAHTAKDRELAFFGRCRSGRRWFWVAARYFGEGATLNGFTDTEDDAVDAAMAAVGAFVTASRSWPGPVTATST